MSDPPSQKKKSMFPPSLPPQFATPTKPIRRSEPRSRSVVSDGRHGTKAQNPPIRSTLPTPVQSGSTAPDNQPQKGTTPTSSSSKRKYIEIGSSSSDSESEGSSSDGSSPSDDEDEDEDEERRKRSKRAKGPKLPLHGAVLDQDTLELTKSRSHLVKPNKASRTRAVPPSSHNTKTASIKTEPEDIKPKLEDLDAKLQPDDESILKSLSAGARQEMVKKHVLATILQLCGIRRAQDSAQIQPMFDAKNEPVWFDNDNNLRPNFGIDFEPNYVAWGSDFEARVKNQSAMKENERPYLCQIPASEFRDVLKKVTFTNMKAVWTNVQTGDGKKIAKKAITSLQWGRQSEKSKRRGAAFKLSNLPSEAYEIFFERGYQSEEYPDPKDQSRLVVLEPQYRSDVAKRFFDALDAAHHANKFRAGKTKYTQVEYYKADDLPLPPRANRMHKAPAWFLKPGWAANNEALAKKARPYIDGNATDVPEIDVLNKFCERYAGDARTYTTNAPPALLTALGQKAIPPPSLSTQDPASPADVAPAPIATTVSTNPKVPASADNAAAVAPTIPAPESSTEAATSGNIHTSTTPAPAIPNPVSAEPARSDDVEPQHTTANTALEPASDQNTSEATPIAPDMSNEPGTPLANVAPPPLPPQPEPTPQLEPPSAAPAVRTRRPTQKALAAAETVSEPEDTAPAGRKRRGGKSSSKKPRLRKGGKKSKAVVEDEDEGESGTQELAGSSTHSLRLSVAKGPDGELRVRK